MACSEPTLWLGAITADAGREPGAADSAAVSGEAGAASAGDAGSRAGGPAASAPAPRDAGSGDAGVTLPAASPPDRAAESPSVSEEDSGAPVEPPRGRAPSGFPTVDASVCPAMTGRGTYTFGDRRTRTLSVEIYIAPDARSKPAPGGPLILYWHSFGSSAAEVETGLGQAAIDAAVARGGVVAAFQSKLCASCGLAEDTAWYVEDDAVSDQVVACAIQQARIDPTRVHSLGFSAGAMHSIHLAIVRSQWIASVISYSGGVSNVSNDRELSLLQPVAALLAYGGESDVIAYDFRAASIDWYRTHQAPGWYTMLCDHGDGHALPVTLAAHAYRFLMDHPFGVEPEPYAAAIPAEFPAYCGNMPR